MDVFYAEICTIHEYCTMFSMTKDWIKIQLSLTFLAIGLRFSLLYFIVTSVLGECWMQMKESILN